MATSRPWDVPDGLWELWDQLHRLPLSRLQQAGELEWERAVVDGGHVQAKKMA